MNGCQVTQLPRKHRVPCRKPGVVAVQLGCVHEHVLSAFVCGDHREAVLQRGTDCMACFDIDGHRCQLFAQEVAT